ncbi:MAG: PqqD family protein [Abditibacteriota bacterium]|nr:PqqD family protein [Abditibacteriota bacterium]
MSKHLEKKEVLKVVPERNPNITWSQREDGLIELCVPIKQDLYTRILKKLIRRVPDTRTILLDDEVASDVWLACDGKNNVNAIISRIASKFKLQRRQSETSTTLFLQTLSKKKLIILTYSGGNKKSGKR